VRVDSPEGQRLGALLRERGARVESLDDGALSVSGVSRDRIGDLAAAEGITLHELADQRSSLEDVFFELTESEGGGPR
jgi:ABC-2 type transport system ATP-binding protein